MLTWCRSAPVDFSSTDRFCLDGERLVTPNNTASKDHLGSVTQLLNNQGKLVQRLSYKDVDGTLMNKRVHT